VSDKVKVKNLESCLVCGDTESIDLNLPNYPLTGVYSSEKFNLNELQFDQLFSVCLKCNHGQLNRQIDPNYLYSENYGFRTSSSESSKQSNRRLANWIQSIVEIKNKVILEFGANDHSLLSELRNFGRAYAVDPLHLETSKSLKNRNIITISKFIEDVSLSDINDTKVDIVLGIHTLEHLSDPVSALDDLAKLTHDETIFILEFPNLDNLIRNSRFDQITHQHVQYFSVRSIKLLLDKLNFKVLYWDIDGEIYGSMRIIFSKTSNIKITRVGTNKPLDNFDDSLMKSIEKFQSNVSDHNRLFKKFSVNSEIVKIYGAGQTTSTLLYHLSELRPDEIYDDDTNKVGLYYPYISTPIKSGRHLEFDEGVHIFIGALEVRKQIKAKLLNQNVGNIIDFLGG
jgi:hypothetical protein